MNRCLFIAVVAFGASFCFAGAAPPATEADSVILRIQQRISRGDRSEADLLLRDALRRWPGNSGLFNLGGILRAMDGDEARAESDFRRAVELDPRMAAAWKNLGKLYLAQAAADSAAKAGQAFGRALGIDPNDNEARLEMARLLEWRGEFSASLRELDRLTAAWRRRPIVSALRCADLAGLGRAAQAEAEAATLAHDPELTEHDALAAIPVLERKLPASALLLIQSLEAKHLATELSRAHLGTIFEGIGDLAKAREAFETAANGNRRSAAPLLDLARVAYKQKDIDGALGYVAHARDIDPENAAVHFFFGMLAVEKNLPLEARKSLAKAVKLAPGQPSYNYAMGAVSLQGPDAAEAIPYFKRYVELTHGDPRGRFALGVAWFTCGNYDAARRELTPLVSTPATAAGAHYFLGRIDKLDGSPRKAAEHFERSIEHNPDYPEAHAALAMILIQASEFSRAAAEIELALKLDPENASANRDLLVLFQRTHDDRAGAQAAKVAEIESKRDEKVNLLFRTIQVRPY